jgi:hypothetical protein
MKQIQAVTVVHCLLMLVSASVSSLAFAGDIPAGLTAAQVEAADKLKAKGGTVFQIAVDTDALSVGLAPAGKNISDSDLELVKILPKVQQLNLAGTAITDAGLSHIAGLTAVAELHLENTKVTDAGLGHLRGWTNLTYLNLYNTSVTNAGLAQLHQLKNLKRLYLWQTKVTESGAADLKRALPDVVINRGEEAIAALIAVDATKIIEKLAAEKAVADKIAEEKRAAEKKAREEKLAKTPDNTKCPVSDNVLDAEMKKIIHEDVLIGLCCEKCLGEFYKDPKKYTAKLTPGATPTTQKNDEKAADKSAREKPEKEKTPENADKKNKTEIK